MKAKVNLDNDGNVESITIKEKDISYIVKEMVIFEFDILKKELLQNLTTLSELFENENKLATESRGLNQKGIEANRIRINNLISSMRKGIELKIT